MKYSNDYQSGGDEKSRSGKGFYIALAVCLVAVAGVAVVTFWSGSSMTGDESTPTITTTATRTTMTTTTSARQVGVTVTGIPDERTTNTTTATKTAVTTTTLSAEGLFVFPVSNTILRSYSDSPVYSETLGEWRTHNGVDFAAESGAQVKAPSDGTIKAIGKDPLWGDMIEIDHGDKLVSRCYGVVAKNIKVGQKVSAGQLIGTISSVPSEILDESHLHFEIIVNGNYQDPMTLIHGEAVTKTNVTAATTAKK